MSRPSPSQMAATIRRKNRTAANAFLRSEIASAEYRPCFQLALRLRSSPSGVRGPVLIPRAFGSDWALKVHCRACRFAWIALRTEAPLAPTQGVLTGCVHGLHSPICGLASGVSPSHPPWPQFPRDYRLTTFTHMYMLDCDDLTATGSNALQSKEARVVCRRQGARIILKPKENPPTLASDLLT